MDGHIYYFDEVPTKESLTQSLNVYFSFWGATDLQDYLTNVGLDEANIVSISVGGEAVSFVSNVHEKESQEIENEDNASQNIFLEDSGDLSKSTVVMLYAGFVITAAVIALLIFRHYIGRKRRKRDVQLQSHETRSSKKSNDGGNERNRDSSNKPKKNSRKMRGIEQSSPSKEQVLPEPKKVSEGIEKDEDLLKTFADKTPVETEKSHDSKFGQERTV